MNGVDLRTRGTAQQRHSVAQLGEFVVGELPSGLHDDEQELFDRTCDLAGSDEAEGRTDTAQAVGLPVRERDDIESGLASVALGRGFDLFNFGIELSSESLRISVMRWA